MSSRPLPPPLLTIAAHVVNVMAILALATRHRLPHVALGVRRSGARSPRCSGRSGLTSTSTWPYLLVFVTTLYAVFVGYPFVVAGRARQDREPYLVAVLGSAVAFFGARFAFGIGGLDGIVGVIPVIEGLVLAALLRMLLKLEPEGQRDLGRLALVAGAALAFVTVAIPLQLDHQWITIGWALEGAALAWLYRKVPHRGLLYWAMALLAAVFVRLALNPEVLVYEPRGALRIFNWYLYTYLICAAAMLLAGWWLSKTDDRLVGGVRSSQVLPAAATILLFLLLNIEIADFYATGPTITFLFGVIAVAGPDLHHRLARLRSRSADGRHRHRQQAGAGRGRRAHRGDDIQVLPLRPRLARGAVSRRLVRRPRDLARPGVARAAEVRAVEAEERVMRHARWIGAIVVALGAIVAAQPDQSAPRFERRVETAGAGPRRLAIDGALLAGGSPFRVARRADALVAEGGLADLRLVTDSGAPLPYLLAYPPSQAAVWRPARCSRLRRRRKRAASKSISALSARSMPYNCGACRRRT